LENDPFLAGLARENVRHNGLPDRGYAVEADLLSPASRRAAGLLNESAGLVISNPPFLDPGRARLSPDPRKRRAHVMSGEGPSALAAWIAAAMALVAPGGFMILIHRPAALRVILETLAPRAGEITVLPVYPRLEAAASRVLVRGKKGSRAPLAIAPPLVLHNGNGFTAAAEAIHRGALLIDW
jgi:tRNA1(Val) A37 N6-methylase TrmN6